MFDVRAIADRFGWTDNQVRTRLEVADSLLVPYLQSGRKNKILVNSSGLAVLDRLAQLEGEGLTVTAAVERLQSEMEPEPESQNGKQSSATPKQAEGHSEATTNHAQADGLVELYERLLREKDEHIERLESQNERLWNRVEDLEQLALPNPDRRPWWQRVLGIGHATKVSER